MSFIREDIIQAINSVEAKVDELPSEKRDLVRKNLWEKYPDYPYIPRYDRFSFPHPDAWSWVGEFIQGIKVILFFPLNDEETMFEFEDGKEFVSVYSQCSLHEFFLTTWSFDFIIFFNHHDFLIGIGKAAEWLKQYVKNHFDKATYEKWVIYNINY